MVHRCKNVISVVQAIATRTLTPGISVTEAAPRLNERLFALSRTYESLIEAGEDRVPIRKVVTNETSAFSNRISLNGPPILLDAKAAQTLGLIVHELATNAAKYGPLGAEEGTVTVEWAALNDGTVDQFRFRWIEDGGPPVSQPTAKGFGSVLMMDVASAQLSAQVTRDFHRTGLKYELIGPLSAVGRLDSIPSSLAAAQ
jgi:two-component sensor histidine kinase